MAGKDKYTMSQQALQKSQIIAGVLGKKYQQIEAAEILGLSDRQIRRLVKRVREQGESGVVHGLCGRRSNHAHEERFKSKVLEIYAGRYADFGPTFASEKLLSVEKIRIHPETLRLWLKGSKEHVWQRRGRKHRKWRERKRWFGALVQMDGSHHDWLEGRGPWLVLMGYIDDATNTVYARFYEYEGIIPALDSFKRYIRKHGIPRCVYVDRHSTYKPTGTPRVEDELLNQEALTHVGRALDELGVTLIHANSPQAKGRVERLFKTFQDRLVKEMRLEGIKTLAEANRFLGLYLPTYNRQFSIKPMETADLHRPVPEGLDLDSVLCKKTERVLRNDFTVIHEKKMYQVFDKTKALKVMVEERVNGSRYITYHGKRLRFKEVSRQSELIAAPRRLKRVVVLADKKPAKPYKPPKDHPWRVQTHQAIQKVLRRKQQKEKEAKRKTPMKLWKLMDNSSSSPQLPQYYGDHSS